MNLEELESSFHQYYYAGAALPALELGSTPDLSVRDFDILLRENLTDHDYKAVQTLKRYYDLLNLRSFWLNEALEPYGNWDENQLEEVSLGVSGLDNYIQDFLEKYPHREERVRRFPALLWSYFIYEVKEDLPSFLRDFLLFERRLRLVLAALRAKRYGKEITLDLQDEDPEDELVAQIIAQKDAPQYHPPEDMVKVASIFEENRAHPLRLERALTAFRFEWAKRKTENAVFSLNRLIAYYIRLTLAERHAAIERRLNTQIQ